MSTSTEERIRERAQAIWEREGRPDGRAEEHWRQAEEELHGEEAERDGLLAAVRNTVSDNEQVPTGKDNPISRHLLDANEPGREPPTDPREVVGSKSRTG